jgi:hypothetical protein
MGQLPRITAAEVEVIRIHLNEPEIEPLARYDQFLFVRHRNGHGRLIDGGWLCTNAHSRPPQWAALIMNEHRGFSAQI